MLDVTPRTEPRPPPPRTGVMGEGPLPPAGLSTERGVRARAVLALVPPAKGAGLTGVLDELVEDCWRRYVVARAVRMAPSFLNTGFARKARAGFSTYCALGLSAIVCSRTRPRVVQAACTTARVLGLDARRVQTAGRALLPSMYRLFCAAELERVSLASFLILSLDEILDDVLTDDDPQARARALGGIVRTRRGPPDPLVAMSCAMLERLRTSSGEPARFDRIMERVAEWAHDEVALEIPGARVDARKKTIEVSMELLGFACGKYVGDRELSWMQGIAALGQMVDDFVDVEKDLAAGRRTPAVTGEWNAGTIARLYPKLADDTQALLRDAGERSSTILDVYDETFRAQMRHMAQVLVDNP